MGKWQYWLKCIESVFGLHGSLRWKYDKSFWRDFKAVTLVGHSWGPAGSTRLKNDLGTGSVLEPLAFPKKKKKYWALGFHSIR